MILPPARSFKSLPRPPPKFATPLALVIGTCFGFDSRWRTSGAEASRRFDQASLKYLANKRNGRPMVGEDSREPVRYTKHGRRLDNPGDVTGVT